MKRGFTIVELLVVIVIFGVATALFFYQKLDYDAVQRDEQRKVAINAMFYNLEECYYAKNNHYPEHISENNLTAMDPQLFTDPFEINLGDDFSNYRYEPIDCQNGKCASYTLRSLMEKEADFIRKSRH